jgi:hypothetical protein
MDFSKQNSLQKIFQAADILIAKAGFPSFQIKCFRANAFSDSALWYFSKP